MQLKVEQIEIIEKYTDAFRIDREKLKSYLEKHRTIKAEVFTYCTKVARKTFESRGFCIYLTEEPYYTPVDRDTFIRRIPFYFLCVPMSNGEKETGLSFVLPVKHNPPFTVEQFENFYQDLEWMFYDLCIPLEDIFGYVRNQLYAPQAKVSNWRESLASSIMDEPGLQVRDTFTLWRHYLHLCQQLGWHDYTPERFITAYNYALEACGEAPIIYRPLKNYISYYAVDYNSYIFRGNFPCDKDGNPILRWTTIRVTHPTSITFDAERSRCGELRVDLSPKTTIHLREFYTEENDGAVAVADEEDCNGDKEPLMWLQIYAGPQTMFFNYHALKEFRVARKMTQSEVATAIDTSVRTYQKWESGTTIPDGHNLLRLMCWLNISDAQDLVTYKDFPDEG